MSRLPDPRQARVFRFVEAGYEPATGDATLIYACDNGPPLAETLNFPHTPWPMEPSRQQAFERALQLLHWIAGVSYWKAGVPGRLVSEAGPMDRSAAEFLETLYTDGMAEFAHVNGLELTGALEFEASAPAPPAPLVLDLPERALVAVGGGKDSLVALDRLRDAGVEVQPFCVGASPLIEDTVRAAGLPLLRIGRRLSPLLKSLNEAGAYNGHVPVTAINSAIGLCAALLYGYRWVVFANERSAEAATRTSDDGREINHQYSKTLAFERALRGQVAARISSGLQYFSLLRPWGELAVARAFARQHHQHPVFSSCNRNFHIDGARVEGRWCGDCPKCRFTALALGAFLDRVEVEAFMGANPLDDPGQEAGLRGLCGLGEERPFECIGTVEECRAALRELARRDGWKDAALVRRLAPELEELAVPELPELLTPGGEHCIPRELEARLGETL